MKHEWDVFISYASEDRKIVRSLSDALNELQVRIWVDYREMRLGDRLRGRIEEGLSKSRFGVLIVSPTYLGKFWPERELDVLVSREEQENKVILPVWHGVDEKQVLQRSAVLAHRWACKTSDGIDMVSTEIARVVIESHVAAIDALVATLRDHFVGADFQDSTDCADWKLLQDEVNRMTGWVPTESRKGRWSEMVRHAFWDRPHSNVADLNDIAERDWPSVRKDVAAFIQSGLVHRK